jgi:hypothetical protein
LICGYYSDIIGEKIMKKYFTPMITPRKKGCHRGQVGFLGQKGGK